MNADAYDFVIAGGGSAGCVLAHRLSEDSDVRVLLLEAGGTDWNPLIHIPLGVGKIRQARMYDWGYDTEPEPNLNNRKIEIFRGKVLGGSSSINFMGHNRGNRSDYERWARSGLPGWSYANLLPYFKRTETWRDGSAPHRGTSGPLGVRYTCRRDPLGWAILDAARSAGIPIFDDVNGAEPDGFGLAQSAIDYGRRASSARAFLRPALSRKNLTVKTRSLATRILFEGKTAVGLEYLRGGALCQARAERELILAAGAINSPQLLMLSGIGDADQLRPLGISSTLHLPGVGANLQDHLAASVAHRRIGAESPLHRTLRADRLALALIRAFFTGKGPATDIPSGVSAVLRSRAGLDGPDIQYLFGSGTLEAKPWFPGLGAGWRDMFNLRAVALHPESRGTVSLVSSDPTQKARIQARFLSAPNDWHTLREGIRIAREVFRQKALDAFRGEEISPGPSCTSAADIDAFIRRTAVTVYHPSCTCRMGQDELAVVDPELRVRGIERLRVVDASVMPDLVSCNINACVLVIAERASDLIRGGPPLPAETCDLAAASA